jgi:hypothetical protein
MEARGQQTRSEGELQLLYVIAQSRLIQAPFGAVFRSYARAPFRKEN